MSAGPWRPIRLEFYQSRIAEIHFPVQVSEDLKSARIDFTIGIESPPPACSVRVALYNPPDVDHLDDRELVFCEIYLLESDTIKESISVDNPMLWYPIEYGSQPLYEIVVDLYSNSIHLDSKSQSLGIRRARVIQSPLIDEEGATFYFEINSIPIFCAGANWIPADNLPTQVTPFKYREWLQLVVKGNQNMIRVWGGGIYEHDAFYSAADDLGILIWQDFMFACGQYPAHKHFRENVEREAITQVKRLRHHPSVVIFVGNNEDYQIAESAGLQWDPSDPYPENWLKTTFPARYIYEKLLPEVVHQYAPNVFYHPGSPWSDGKPTSDRTIGDIHQWNGPLSQTKHSNLALADSSLAWVARIISIVPSSRGPIYIRIRDAGASIEQNNELLYLFPERKISAIPDHGSS